MENLLSFTDFFINEGYSNEGDSLQSIQWDFWNQSRTRNFHLYNSEKDFNKLLDFYKEDLTKLSDTMKIPSIKIEKHLQKLWDASRKGKYIDMHTDRDKFKKFIEKNKIEENV